MNAMHMEDQIKFTVVISDITERKAAQEEIQLMAMTDPLTGLANRNRFHMRLTETISLAKRNKKLMGLMLLDLDRFKPVNDTYGHPVGDALLLHVSELLKEISRTTDTVARLGGDEFAVILSEPETKASVHIPAQRIIEAIHQPVVIEGHTIQIGVSIGISFYPNDGEDTDQLTKLADFALYEAKEAGRNTFKLFDPDTMKSP